MYLKHKLITCSTVILLGILVQSVLADDAENSTESNEIIPRDAIKKLDYSVRQALLRAIDKLEQEAELNDDVNLETVEENTTIEAIENTPTNPTSVVENKYELNEDVVKINQPKPTVQFYTATLDEKNTPEQLLSTFIDDAGIWRQKNPDKAPLALSLGSPVTVGASKKPDEAKEYQTLTRSVSPSISTNEIFRDGSAEIQFEIRKSATSAPDTTTTTTIIVPQTTRKRKPTTTTTTTTTTPRPTHNEDGENIEIVDKQDIRIQEAPLVSAFTVALDESGAAKKVVPIVHQPGTPKQTSESFIKKDTQPNVGPTIAKLQVSTNNFHQSPIALPLNAPPPVLVSTKLNTQNQAPVQAVHQQQTSFNTKPTTTNENNFLIERQKRLEQEIYELKVQAQQQQQLILRQLKLLEEQTKLSQTEIQPSVATVISPQTAIQHQSAIIQQRPQQVKPDVGFTIRPSVEYVANPVVKTTTTTTNSNSLFSNYPSAQQLPLKENRFTYNPNNLIPNFQVQQTTQQQLPLAQALQTAFHSNIATTVPPSKGTIQIQQATLLNNFQQPPQQQQQQQQSNEQQQLPQYAVQQFQTQPTQLVPAYVTNAIQKQQQQQQQQRARLFRQESGTTNILQNDALQQQQQQQQFPNFINQPQTILPLSQTLQQQQLIENQNFYRQHLAPHLSSQMQQNAQFYHQQLQQQQQPQPQNSITTALNHGINQFAPSNSRYKNVGF